jgi:hypothetical protein
VHLKSRKATVSEAFYWSVDHGLSRASEGVKKREGCKDTRREDGAARPHRALKDTARLTPSLRDEEAHQLRHPALKYRAKLRPPLRGEASILSHVLRLLSRSNHLRVQVLVYIQGVPPGRRPEPFSLWRAD